jgi:hypothetical protein
LWVGGSVKSARQVIISKYHRLEHALKDLRQYG